MMKGRGRSYCVESSVSGFPKRAIASDSSRGTDGGGRRGGETTGGGGFGAGGAAAMAASCAAARSRRSPSGSKTNA
jgi:hypothetical protein